MYGNLPGGNTPSSSPQGKPPTRFTRPLSQSSFPPGEQQQEFPSSSFSTTLPNQLNQSAPPAKLSRFLNQSAIFNSPLQPDNEALSSQQERLAALRRTHTLTSSGRFSPRQSGGINVLEWFKQQNHDRRIAILCACAILFLLSLAAILTVASGVNLALHPDRSDSQPAISTSTNSEDVHKTASTATPSPTATTTPTSTPVTSTPTPDGDSTDNTVPTVPTEQPVMPAGGTDSPPPTAPSPVRTPPPAPTQPAATPTPTVPATSTVVATPPIVPTSTVSPFPTPTGPSPTPQGHK